MVVLLKGLIHKGLKSEFLKNTSTLLTGTVLAQLIPILIQPILRRYFSAEIFGSYAVYISLIGILYVITSLRYEQAIILPKNDSEACSILNLSQIFNLLISFLLLIFVISFNQQLLSFLNIPAKHKIFLYFVPFGTFLFNFHQAINLWLIRKKAFLSVSKNKLVRRSVEGSFQLLFRFFKVNIGLLIGDIIGQLFNVLYGVRISKKNGLTFKPLNLKVLVPLAQKYSEYPKFNTITTLFNALSALLPVILINKFYGAENTAYFDLSRLLLLTPIALLASSISNVMLQRISEKKHKQIFFGKELVLILTIGLAIGLVEVIVILLWGEQLFSFLFGQEWAYSGEISKLLLWPYIIYFFSFSLTSIFLALKKIKLLSIYQIINFVLIVSLSFMKGLSFTSFLKTLVSLNFISMFIFSIFVLKVIRQYYNGCNASLKSEIQS